MDIIKKSQEWAAQYGSILTASATTRFPTLYKGAVGGLEHVISVDNGAAYMELWRDGSGSYYATTGAAIKQMPGLAKGAALDEALDKFFALTAKLAKGQTRQQRQEKVWANIDAHPPKPAPAVKKGKTYRDRQGVTQPNARKRSPFKKNVTDDPNVGPYGGPKPGLKKHNIKTLHSHGPQGEHLTPEYVRSTGRDPAGAEMRPKVWPKPPKPKSGTSTQAPWRGAIVAPGARKARKGIMEKVDPEIGPSFSVGHIKPSDLSPESSVSKMARRVIKDVLHHAFGDAQTPASKPKFDGQKRAARKDIVGLSGGMPKPPRPKPGFGEPARVNRPVGRGPRLITNIEGGRVAPGGGISPVRPRTSGPGAPVGYGSTGQPQYSYKRAMRKQPAQMYQSPQGFSGRRMGAPGAAAAAPPRPNTRFGKACSPCREVAKAVREVNKVVATPAGVSKRK